MPLSEPDAVGAHLPASCMQQRAAVAHDDDAMAVQELALFTFLLATVCLAGILLGTWIKRKEAMRYDASPSSFARHSFARHLSSSRSSCSSSSGRGSFSSRGSEVSRSASSSIVAAQLEQLRVKLATVLPHAAQRGGSRQRRRVSTEDSGLEVFHSPKANTSVHESEGPATPLRTARKRSSISTHGTQILPVPSSESMGRGGSEQSQASTVVSSLASRSVSTEDASTFARRLGAAIVSNGEW